MVKLSKILHLVSQCFTKFLRNNHTIIYRFIINYIPRQLQTVSPNLGSDVGDVFHDVGSHVGEKNRFRDVGFPPFVWLGWGIDPTCVVHCKSSDSDDDDKEDP